MRSRARALMDHGTRNSDLDEVEVLDSNVPVELSRHHRWAPVVGGGLWRFRGLGWRPHGGCAGLMGDRLGYHFTPLSTFLLSLHPQRVPYVVLRRDFKSEP